MRAYIIKKANQGLACQVEDVIVGVLGRKYANFKGAFMTMIVQERRKFLFVIKNQFGERLANAYFLKEMAYALANDKNR